MSNRSVALLSALELDVRACGRQGFDIYRNLPPSGDSTFLDYALYSICKSITKKLIPSDTTAQDEAAWNKFSSCNLACENYVDRANTSLDEILTGTFKKYLYDFFNPGGLPLLDSLDSIFLRGRVGPGAALGATGGDLYSKMFSSPLTCTSTLLIKHYEQNVRRWPEWANAEIIRSLNFGIPKRVEGSRLSFAPKNDSISRSICTEPGLNMFYQLGAGAIISDRLKSYLGIDLTKQPEINREMARIGSLEDSWSTIDLESASDTISLSMLKLYLDRYTFGVLGCLRSHTTEYKGARHTLNMLSTMGNGFTFPLQTAIFACAVKSCYASLDIPTNIRNNYGVFGDDIIIVKAAYHRLLRLLDLLGFKVNTTKSFNEGPFRESCGRDYFLGRNVRGVYPKRLNTAQDFYALINAINDFSARTGVVLRNLMNFARSHCDMSVMVPKTSDYSSGVQVPFRFITSRLLCKDTQAVAFTQYEPTVKKYRIGDRFIFTPRGVKYRIYNPSGLLLGFLSGMALSSGLPARQEQVNWKKKRASCSYWDVMPSEIGFVPDFDWQQWDTAVHLNLFD